MSELQFAKQFLIQVSSKPIRYNSDYADDLRNLQVRGPFILPKFPKALTKVSRLEDPPVNITVKTLRPPHISLNLPAAPAKTPILALKLTISDNTGVPLDKIKLLFKGKVLNDVTMLKEIIPEDEENRELVFTIMLMAGAVPNTSTRSTFGIGAEEATTATRLKSNEKSEAAAEGADKMDIDSSTKLPTEASGKARLVLDTEDFWADLGGFLSERLGSKVEAENILDTFREAWTHKLQ